MQLMVDTHVLIWWWANDDRLPERLRILLGQDSTVVYVSAVCALEMAIKVRNGQLPAMEPYVHQFHEAIVEDGFIRLVVKEDHALKGGLLPGAHRDPFDRLLAAQSLLEDLPIVTQDAQIAAFGCQVIW